MKSGIFVALMLAQLQLSAYAQQTYKLDVSRSKVLWKAPQNMGKTHHGYLLFNSGSLFYSAAAEPLKGSFSMNMHTITSEGKASDKQQEVDGVLKGEDFFSVVRYPSANMYVSQVQRSGASGVYTVKGNLTIKGITHPIVFKANLLKKGNVVIANADLSIDRNNWNIRHQPKPWGLLSNIKEELIPDEIPVSLRLVFSR